MDTCMETVTAVSDGRILKPPDKKGFPYSGDYITPAFGGQRSGTVALQIFQ